MPADPKTPIDGEAGRVRVKPLVWREHDLAHDYGRGSWEAYGSGHGYEILDVGGDGKNGYRFYLRGVSQFPTLDEAKAAAQGDHEARILSALEPTQPVQEAEAGISREKIEEILAGCEGVTPGPWFSDEDDGDQFQAYAVFGPERNGRPSSVCDTHNAGEILIEQEDGRPWDEQGRKNMAHIANLDPITVKALCRLALQSLDHTPSAEEVAK